MAKSAAVGTMKCPECDFPDAEVKRQKTGLLYRWCPECSAQFFARTPEASARLEAKMKPVNRPGAPVSDTEKTPDQDRGPIAVTGRVGDKKAGFDLGAL